MAKPTRHARKKPLRLEAKAYREAMARRARIRRYTTLYGSVGLAVVVAAFGVFFLVNRDDGSVQGGAAAAATPSPAPDSTVAPTTTVPATNDARADATTAPAKAACNAKTPKRVKRQTYTAPPAKVIKDGATYDANVKTSCGSFTIRLDPKAAPQTVNSIVSLARAKFYDSTWFHRIVPGGAGSIGVIQGGDPTGTGTGDAGYKLPDEFPTSPSAYTKYTVAMANAGPGSTGTQFFINFQDNTQGLQPSYTLIGEVTKGRDVIDKIARTPVGGASGDTPTEAVWIERMIIKQNPAS
jgi:peptidyl-prolyl cis-trans isomerase B (cyclophilin B)